MVKDVIVKGSAFVFYAALTGFAWGQTVIVEPMVSTAPTAGNADDPAIWIHPDDPARSVIIGTDKDEGIYVWDMNGNQLQHIEQGTATNNVDVRYDVQLGGQSVDVAAANLRDAGKLAVFTVNPNYTGDDVLTQIADRSSSNNDIQDDSYGFGLYRRPSDGALFVFERPKNRGEIRQYRIEDDGSGNGVTVTAVRDLNYNGGTAEGFVADDELGHIYIAEEGEGVHKYRADPDQGDDDVLLTFATDDGISGDREGIALYACSDGTGYLILSSQGNSRFKVYERQGNNQFVKTINPRDNNGDDGLGTDGLDVTSFGASSDLPNGFLVAHDEDAARFHIYDWAQIAENDLTICPNGGGATSVNDPASPQPEGISLHQNYPNPFNPETSLQFELSQKAHVTLKIHNLLGQEVTTLLQGTQEAGFHALNWNGKNSQGEDVPTGVYIYRLQVRFDRSDKAEFVETRKMTLLR